MKLKKIKKLSTKKTDKIINNVKASLAFEGLDLTLTEVNIIKNYLTGNLKENELINIINM